MRLSVVVPCFNEEGNVARVVGQAAEVGRTLASELEIVVVDDGSTDDTAAVLGELQREVPELKIVSHPLNRGYGAAVRSGLQRASMEYVFLTDGDGQFDLAELLRVIQLYNANAYACATPDGESNEDGFVLGNGDETCAPHASDYAPQDWSIGLSELLRLIQFFTTGGYVSSGSIRMTRDTRSRTSLAA